jgi:hypothetical protein
LKKANWREIAELVGIVAIVISLFLVAYELRQNTIASRQQAAATYAASARDLDLFVSGDSEISSIVFKSITRQDLSPEENFRLSNFYRSVLRTWQDTHYQYVSETLDDEIWSAERRFMRRILIGDPGFRRFWRINQEIYTDEFQLLITQILEDIESDSDALE